jgi:hypothetical protein
MFLIDLNFVALATNTTDMLIADKKLIKLNKENLLQEHYLIISTKLDSFMWYVKDVPKELLLNKKQGVLYKDMQDTIIFKIDPSYLKDINTSGVLNRSLIIENDNNSILKIRVFGIIKGKVLVIALAIIILLIFFIVVLIKNPIETLFSTIVIVLFLTITEPEGLIPETSKLYKWIEIHRLYRIASIIDLILSIIIFNFSRKLYIKQDHIPLQRIDYIYDRRIVHRQMDPDEALEIDVMIFSLINFALCLLFIVLSIFVATWIIKLIIPTFVILLIICIFRGIRRYNRSALF